MPILVELNTSKVVIWKDTADVIWLNTASAVWFDGEDTSTLRFSMDGVALDHYWDAYIESFSSPQYQTATDYGGFVRMGFGQIAFSPDAFAADWVPPKQHTIAIKYTATTEGLAVTLFTGDIYLNSFDEEIVTYTLNDPKYTQKLLDVGPDYKGNTVPYPKAFGSVTHVEPLRLADNAGRPCYHLGGISTTIDAKTIISFSSSATGTKTQVVTSAAHGWSTGNSIYISGTVNFDGTHVIESASGSTFVIPVTFPTDNSEYLPIHANAFISGGFAVFDDGVPIQSNVVVIGDGSFALTASPVGTVTISGTASQTDLEGVMTWGNARLGGGSAIVSTNARGTSPAISYWATSQKPLIDFLSDICAFFTHYFYIKDSVLTLGDMLLDNGSETLDEFSYFTAQYNAGEVISQIKSTWTTHEAENGFVDEIRTARFIKAIQNTVIESLQTISSGTTDGTNVSQLIDSGATFSTDGVKAGYVAQNTTDDTSAVVLSVSETALTLDDDIFISGETYVVGPSFPYGNELTIEPYHDTKSNVSAALVNILTVLNKDVAEVRIPISATLPDPGKRISFSDTQMVVDTSTWIRARIISYDFENDEAVITGEGIIS